VEDVESRRHYRGPSEIWNMVARSAFTQLRYSPLILLLLTVAMALLFLYPVAGVAPAAGKAASTGWEDERARLIP
jgi:hypothetical protein